MQNAGSKYKMQIFKSISYNARFVVMCILILIPLIASFGCSGTDYKPIISATSIIAENTTGTELDKVPRITADELRKQIQNNTAVIIVDSRSGVEKLYDEGHIKGAIPVPLDVIVKGEWIPTTNLDAEIVFYCSCPDEHTAASAAMVLITRGYTNVKALKGGYNTWLDAKYPIESASINKK
jgi:rhodanese-related sulfurtransferase